MSCSLLDLSLARQDVVVFKGGGIAVLLEILQELADGSDGPPVDLSGWSDFEIVVFDPASPDGDPLARYSTDDGTLVVLDASLGQLQWDVDAEAVADYTWMDGQYYFRATDPQGNRGGFVGGTFTLTWTPPTQSGQEP